MLHVCSHKIYLFSFFSFLNISLSSKDKCFCTLYSQTWLQLCQYINLASTTGTGAVPVPALLLVLVLVQYQCHSEEGNWPAPSALPIHLTHKYHWYWYHCQRHLASPLNFTNTFNSQAPLVLVPLPKSPGQPPQL